MEKWELRALEAGKQFSDGIHQDEYQYMTLLEYIQHECRPRTVFDPHGYDEETVRCDHLVMVKEAMELGENIPNDVLADYPPNKECEINNYFVDANNPLYCRLEYCVINCGMKCIK